MSNVNGNRATAKRLGFVNTLKRRLRVHRIVMPPWVETMIEFAWSGGELFYRERSFQVDAAGAFCGVTDFGEWKKVPTLHDFPPQEPVDAQSA